MLFDSQSIELRTAGGQPVKVHLVSTGGVFVKSKFRDAKRTGLLAKIDFIFDRKFTEWMPIWVMIIEHPEGIFVIDTGENANINDPGYFKSSGRLASWFNTTQYKFKVDRFEEIDRQLVSLGILSEKVKAVILTHLHLDHIDGIRHFPKTTIIVNKDEWENPYGDLPKLYPSWFKPELVELNEVYDVFDRAYYITQVKDIALIQTPGHTWHHCSVILKTDKCHIFFGADICYSQQQLIDQKYSGANASHKLSADTYSKVRAFCKLHNTVFIPSHEAAAAERLANLQSISIP
jgi:glyoxylase-like metal-dependent hydrolase (beta-lactamase superfamily II)